MNLLANVVEMNFSLLHLLNNLLFHIQKSNVDIKPCLYSAIKLLK